MILAIVILLFNFALFLEEMGLGSFRRLAPMIIEKDQPPSASAVPVLLPK